MAQALPVTSFFPRRKLFTSPWREVTSWSGVLPVCFNSRALPTTGPLDPLQSNGAHCQEGILWVYWYKMTARTIWNKDGAPTPGLCPVSISGLLTVFFLCGINNMIHPEQWPLLKSHTGTSDLKTNASVCPCSMPGPCLIPANTRTWHVQVGNCPACVFLLGILWNRPLKEGSPYSPYTFKLLVK